MMILKDRKSAGKLVAKHLRQYKGQKDAIVLGIPRGGVVVASAVAKILRLPLDIIVTRKIGAPNQKELALGAVDADGEAVWDEKLLKDLRLGIGELAGEVTIQQLEILRRESTYRQDRNSLNVGNKIVILVDDGIATGATTLAALRYLKRHGVKKIILAVPVASREAIERVIREIGKTGEVVVLDTPEYFQAVGQFYQNFQPVEDEEVIQLLR